MRPRADQAEAVAEGRGQRFRAVADDREATATFGTVKREGRDDRMRARTQSAAQRLQIGRAIVGIGEEVENRAIVPEVVLLVGR